MLSGRKLIPRRLFITHGLRIPLHSVYPRLFSSSRGFFEPINWNVLTQNDIPAALRDKIVLPSKPPKTKKTKKVAGEPRTTLTGAKVKHIGLVDLPPVTSLRKPEVENIARLAHNLDRVLFSPGVHYQKDPRTGVYNFTPFLSQLPSFTDDSEAHLNQYTPPSKDRMLQELTSLCHMHEPKKYFSLTSSMTGCLSQFHYLLSGFRPPATVDVAKNITSKKYTDFSPSAVSAASVVITKKKGLDGRYAIDADKSSDTPSFLSEFGICMEKILTHTPKKFRGKFRADIRLEPPPEVYNYSTFQKFVMRSQLDCYDPRLPGNGTFDLKTRSVCAIRYDQLFTEAKYRNPDASIDYLIHQSYGVMESFEREFYDLIRTGMLKYSLQARIGMMDGIFICYHNTELAFGYQYVPLVELDKIFHSHVATAALETNLEELYLDSMHAADADYSKERPTEIAEAEFRFSMHLWEQVLEKVTSMQPDSSIRLVMKALKQAPGTMDILVCPLTEEEVVLLQDRKPNVTPSTPYDAKLVLLDEYLDELARVNESTMHKAQLLHLTVRHFFGSKRPCALAHPSPVNQAEIDSWALQFKLKKSKRQRQEVERMYVRFLDESVFFQMPGDENPRDGFIRRLRRFSKFGKERKGEMGKQEVWEPVHANDLM
ncbi:hypothetical protein BABINDRAFT_163526 [Babjeviella inositovora NRRL Y-12698]|uniref:Pet127-domain-containing protein n=1 Tax=Babjeviella inositovora NRRL Y-12698 TaxID=984486 RepID=A0A1E3QJ97_9ASCO|nr:uncharacterized protein BABINDRAFT_163526 [Babjeviella inositovora NRRL Y-12698]ODQ77524.1 hypothetical protein BABINDRAFT_163526 [Babjeviella inositovora NRRL Y-12698]